MSTQSELGQCFKCAQEGVSRPGVIDYCGSLVCRDHCEKDIAVDGQPDLEYPAGPGALDYWAQSQTMEVPKHG